MHTPGTSNTTHTRKGHRKSRKESGTVDEPSFTQVSGRGGKVEEAIDYQDQTTRHTDNPTSTSKKKGSERGNTTTTHSEVGHRIGIVVGIAVARNGGLLQHGELMDEPKDR